METEITKKPSSRKLALLILVIFLGVVLIYYAFMAMQAPVKRMDAMREEYSLKQKGEAIVNDTILSDSLYLALFREKSFLQARSALAETDSIYLSMNLVDTVVSLEINGVSVATTRFSKLSMSKMLKDRNNYIVSSFFSKPFTIERSFSSIPREPLVIKMAPKDTSEFEPDIPPDTADYEPANYILETDNGAVLYFYQEEKLNKNDGMHLFLFDLRYRLRNTLGTMKSVFTFKLPEYHPFIKIRLPRSDAKIIYRALPVRGQIAVYR
jgi:hypothetical protein